MYTTPNYVLFSLGNQEYDVFIGKEWDHWSRFKKENKILKLVKGQPLPKEIYEQLLKDINNALI